MCGCVDSVVALAVGGRHAQLEAASARENAAARGGVWERRWERGATVHFCDILSL